MIAPVLHTARLTLSPPTVGDFDDIAALWADPVVARYTGAASSFRVAEKCGFRRRSAHPR